LRSKSGLGAIHHFQPFAVELLSPATPRFWET
jgi:hypothetical protein